MARPSLSCALGVGGFPVYVQVYTLAPAGSPSYKSLCPCHEEPIEQVKRCVTTGDVIAHEALIKSVDVGGTLVPLDADDVASIKALTEQRTTMTDMLQLPPLDSVPWHLSIGRYRIVPNPKVPGTEGSLGIIWNGLYADGCAMIVQWIKRAGSKPVIAALRAEEDGTLLAIELPYAANVRDDEVPSHTFEVNTEAAGMFSMFATQQGIDRGPFMHDAYTDEVAAERERIVAAKLDGIPIPEAPKAEKPPEPVPDLMAMMRASIAAAAEPAEDDAPVAAPTAPKPKTPAPAVKPKAGTRRERTQSPASIADRAKAAAKASR